MPLKKVVIPVLIFILAAIVYSQFGFYGELLRDDAIFLYGGQRLAEGVPPYIGVFDVKGPIIPMATGLGVVISKWLDWDDVYTVRLLFLCISSLAVVATYLLGKSLFKSRRVGIFAALTFLGFFDFAQEAASGPRAKTLVVLFGTLSLFFTSRKRWFWAGFCGALSALTWQPTGIFLLVTLILAVVQSREERFRAVSFTLIGIGLPAAAIVQYFHSQNALYELLDGILLFHFRYRAMPSLPLFFHFYLPLRAIIQDYRMMVLPITIGFVMFFNLYFWRRSLHNSLKETLVRDEFSALLLSFPLFVIWSAMDFQGAPDFYVFLPYVAIGFACFLDIAVSGIEKYSGRGANKLAARLAGAALCIMLVGSAVADLRLHAGHGYFEQLKSANEIERRYGNVKIVSIGAPQILVILHRVNPNPYAVISVGIDRRIHDTTLGGFDGWLRELAAYDPDVIAYGPTGGMHVHKLMKWMEARYHEEQIGPWKLYVKNSLKD